MSTNKRRQVIKDIRQTQIPFPQTKNYGDSFPAQAQPDYTKKAEPKPYAQYSGAKEITTPYRSLNRVKSLLCRSPYQVSCGTPKLFDTAAQNFLRKVGQINSESKPSSATTACTYAPNDFSVSRCDSSPKGRKKREVKKDKKNQTTKQLIGVKRQEQIKLDTMEYFVRLTSKNAKLIAQMFKLRDKKTGQVYDFPIFQENQLAHFKGNPIITNFDMTKLEVEYDYDTDGEQLKHSKKMLFQELLQAIEFFIKDDPIKLVDNVLL